MAHFPKTKANPYGLSPKQQAVIIDLVDSVKNGRGLNPTVSTAKVYNTKNPKVIASQNLSRLNFREALLSELKGDKIVGEGGKVNKVLKEGLNAYKVTKYGDQEDYAVRLAYVQEINKIIGIYAPDRIEKRSINLNVNLTDEELDKRIRELQQQVY